MTFLTGKRDALSKVDLISVSYNKASTASAISRRSDMRGTLV